MRPLLAGLLIGSVLAGCSSGPPEPSRREAELYMQGLGGRGMVLRAGTDVNRLYAETIAQKERGDCAAATPNLQKIASLGPGYENAQTALGECLLEKASADNAAGSYNEALMWLRRAADAGWPEAQFRMAYTHALGTATIRSADEAGYWLALYAANTGKLRVGFVAPPPAQVAALDTAVPEAAKKAGAARAATWRRQVWIPPNPPPSAPGPTGRARRSGPGETPLGR